MRRYAAWTTVFWPGYSPRWHKPTVRPSQDWLEAMMQAEAWRAWGESKD